MTPQGYGSGIKCAPFLKEKNRGLEMVQWTLALTEDPGSIPRTHRWLTTFHNSSSRGRETLINSVAHQARLGWTRFYCLSSVPYLV